MGDHVGVTETEVSVVTLAELTLGVLMDDDEHRATRVATLSAVESTWIPLPIDAEAARRFAQVMADLWTRGRRIPVLDALIAVTALVQRLAVVTQDGDYESIAGLEVIRV